MKEIKIDKFTVKRGSFILKPVSLTIKKSEIFAILGYTGSGKTVLLEAIAGMFEGDSGSVLYDGTEVTSIVPENRQIGIVYQNHGLFPHMKIADNIAYGLKMHHFEKKKIIQRTEELLDLFEIRHIKDQYPGTISGGEGQRAALARALALEPSVLLLDEPFSALDPSTRKMLYKIILKIHDKLQCTIVFVTHDFKEAQILADRVGILLGGELLAVTDGKNLMEKRYCEKVEAFLGRSTV